MLPSLSFATCGLTETLFLAFDITCLIPLQVGFGLPNAISPRLDTVSISYQVVCPYFHILYSSFLRLRFAKSILFIHAGLLVFLPGLLLFEVDNS